VISQAPIPKEYAITVQTQKYNARELMRWFKVSGKRTVPHTRDKLNHGDIFMVLYRAMGSREFFKKIIKQLNNLKDVQTSSEASYKDLVAVYNDIELFNYLFLQDYMNLRGGRGGGVVRVGLCDIFNDLHITYILNQLGRGHVPLHQVKG